MLKDVDADAFKRLFNVMQHQISCIEKCLILMPLVAIAWLYCLVLLYRMQYGFWPYAHSLYESASLVWHSALFLLGVIATITFFSPVMFLPIQIFRRFYFKHNVAFATFVYLLVWFLWALLMYTDFGGFVDWFLESGYV